MFINNIVCAANNGEWVGLGMTAADWAAGITVIILIISTLCGLLILVLKDKLTNPLSIVIDKLSDSVDRLVKANDKRDQQYKELTEHVAKHDQQFVRDEERINEIYRQLNNTGGSNDDKQN